jgi:hypothetical protein
LTIDSTPFFANQVSAEVLAECAAAAKKTAATAAAAAAAATGQAGGITGDVSPKEAPKVCFVCNGKLSRGARPCRATGQPEHFVHVKCMRASAQKCYKCLGETAPT